MKFKLSLMLLLTVAAAAAAFAQNQTSTFDGATKSKIVTFDAPGAGTGPYQGTQAFDVNPAGAITGQYNDSSGVYHGFVRHPDGHITKFNVPGAGKESGQGTNNVYGSNPAGAITGYYSDSSNVYHGFLRTP